MKPAFRIMYKVSLTLCVLCKIWSFHSIAVEDSGLLRYYT